MDALRELIEQWLAREHRTQHQLGKLSGVPQNIINRWLNVPDSGASPKNLKRIAPVLGLSYEDLLRRMGELPPVDEQAEDAIGPDIRMLMQRYASVVFSYPRSMWATVIEANIQMNQAFKSLAGEPDTSDALSAAADGAGTNKTQSQAAYTMSDEAPKRGSGRAGDDLTASKQFALAPLGV